MSTKSFVFDLTVRAANAHDACGGSQELVYGVDVTQRALVAYLGACEALEAFEAQTEDDRLTLRVHVSRLSTCDALAVWARQNERERSRRATFETAVRRAGVVLDEAVLELETAITAAENQARTLELARLRHEREAMPKPTQHPTARQVLGHGARR